MNLSHLITTGPVIRAKRVGIHGPPAVGKSTLASQFLRPLFLDTEDGTAELNVERIRIASFEDFEKAYEALLEEQPKFQTVVIDTIDALEKFMRTKLCRKYRKAGIEEFPYGKGWVYLSEEFERLLASLDILISKGLNVVVIGHTAVRRVYLPELPDPFDRYELQLYDRNAARLKQWLDALLFLNWNVRVQEGTTGRMRGLSGKERLIFTTHSAAFDAKNRVGLPEKLPCEIATLAPLFNQSAEISEPISIAPVSAERNTDPTPAQIKPTTSIPNLPTPQERLAIELSGLHEDWITDFLVDRKKIEAGQTIAEAPSSYCESALNRITEFREAVIKFGQEKDNANTVL